MTGAYGVPVATLSRCAGYGSAQRDRRTVAVASRVIPTFRYRDVKGAIEFLSAAFGFEPHLVVEGDNDDIGHAQLTFRNGMIMLGSVRDDAFGRLISEPGAGGHAGATYVIVDDVRAHAEQARAAGAEIVMEPEDQDYGGANYAARDPEGFIWSFGSYDPWADQGAE